MIYFIILFNLFKVDIKQEICRMCVMEHWSYCGCITLNCITIIIFLIHVNFYCSILNLTTRTNMNTLKFSEIIIKKIWFLSSLIGSVLVGVKLLILGWESTIVIAKWSTADSISDTNYICFTQRTISLSERQRETHISQDSEYALGNYGDHKLLRERINGIARFRLGPSKSGNALQEG